MEPKMFVKQLVAQLTTKKMVSERVEDLIAMFV